MTKSPHLPSPSRRASPPLTEHRDTAVRRWLAVVAVAVLGAYGHDSEAASGPVSLPAASAPSLAGDGTPSSSVSDLRSQVLALLARAPEGGPQEAEWRRLGTGSIPILTALAADRAVPPQRRALAVASLALVDPPQGAEAIEALLEDPHAPADVRASAAAALGRCLGVEAVTPLLARLEDPDAHVREAVAQALGRLGGRQAHQALEDRVALEESPLVREALQRGLTLTEP